MTRINLTDTITQAITAVCEENPGAMTALYAAVEMHKAIDPDNGLGPMGPLFNMDDWGIYGVRIHTLFKYHCENQPQKFLMLCRGVQMGFFPLERLRAMSTHRGRHALKPREWDNLEDAICQRVPSFQRREQ